MELHPIDDVRDLRFIERGASLHRTTIQVPIDRAPTELPASALRLRAALERAERRLRERGVTAERARGRLERLERSLPALEELAHDVRALALLGDEEGWACARLGDRLPERVAVAPHFALRPLLRALRRQRRFRVVAASRKHVAAYEGDAHGLRPVTVPGMPSDLEEALGSELEGGALSYRSERPVPGRAANAPVFHGHGGADAGRALDLERWVRIVAGALRDAWADDGVPVVIAAEVRTASELRKRLDLPEVLPADVGGPRDDGSEVELHERVWPVVCAAAEEERRELARHFERARSQGKSAQEFDELIGLAIAGRVRRLWVEELATLPGRIDEGVARRTPTRDPDEDALDALVSLVLRRGGEVCVVDEGSTPTGSACCAELR